MSVSEIISVVVLLASVFTIAGVMANFIRNFKKDMFDRFDKIDARFDKVDARFERVDARFDRIDAEIKELRTGLNRLEGAFHERYYCVKESEPNKATFSDIPELPQKKRAR